MQIREKGKRVLCIRTVYDTDKRRGISQQLLSFPYYTDSITEITDEKERAQLAELRPEEREELIAWLAKRAEEKALRLNIYRVKGIASLLNDAIQSLKDPEAVAALDEAQANEAWLKIRELQQALKAAGFKRPKLSGGDAD